MRILAAAALALSLACASAPRLAVGDRVAGVIVDREPALPANGQQWLLVMELGEVEVRTVVVDYTTWRRLPAGTAVTVTILPRGRVLIEPGSTAPRPQEPLEGTITSTQPDPRARPPRPESLA